MHPTTQAVRAMYERFPYPAGPVTLRLGFDVRRALSFVQPSRPAGRPIHVLDAGCGRGAGLLGMAIAQPDIHFVGIDLNRVALDEVRATARARGLTNVDVAEIDLESLGGLPVPEGGYDLIVSSGVAHHLVDPRDALQRLASHLAPWGVLDLMVYARPGRVDIERVAAVIAEEVPPGPVAERLVKARALVDARASGPALDLAFAEAATMNDVEFVDRYLHPQFVSYELDQLRALVEGAGLSFVRWTDPAGVPVQGAPVDGWAAAAEVIGGSKPRTWDLLTTRAGVARRRPVGDGDVDGAAFALNPEGTLERGVRTMWTGSRATPVTWKHPSRPALPLAEGPAAVAGEWLQQIGRPFRGRELVDHLVRHRVPETDARRLCRLLEHLDVLWRPHEVDLADHPASGRL